MRLVALLPGEPLMEIDPAVAARMTPEELENRATLDIKRWAEWQEKAPIEWRHFSFMRDLGALRDSDSKVYQDAWKMLDLDQIGQSETEWVRWPYY